MKQKWIILTVGLYSLAQAEFVTIGDPNNTADANGYGAVGYTYQISKTEVTIAEFQASGAGNGNENYWNDGTRTVGANAPVSNVTLYEAMKYCNWLTSGNVNNGAYIFSGGIYQSTDRDSAASTYGTVYALPTEDEWYKAAYYTGNSSDPWSLFATGNDATPTWGTANGWNYSDNGYVNDSPNYVWTVDFGGEEQNGTFNMMGNVWEWMETSDGLLRGGNYSANQNSMSSLLRSPYAPSNDYESLGFRIVAVPEPATAGLFTISGLIFYALRRIKNFNRPV